jgi:hypothetical protein
MNIGKAIRLFKVEPLQIPVPRRTHVVKQAGAPVDTRREPPVSTRR